MNNGIWNIYPCLHINVHDENCSFHYCSNQIFMDNCGLEIIMNVHNDNCSVDKCSTLEFYESNVRMNVPHDNCSFDNCSF